MGTTTIAGAAMLLGLLLSACSPSTGEAAPAATATSAAPTQAATEEPSPEPVPTEAAMGTREHPATPDVDTLTFVEAGAPVYEVMLSRANFAANDVISTHFEFNEPAPEGSTYVLLPLTATYLGTETGQAWLDLGITFVAADGRTFEPSLALVPDDLSTTPELTTGGVARGNLSFVIPQDSVTGGMWAVVHEYATTEVPLYYSAL